MNADERAVQAGGATKIKKICRAKRKNKIGKNFEENRGRKIGRWCC